MHALAKYCRKESFAFQFRNVNSKLNKFIFCRGGRYGKIGPNGIKGYGDQVEDLP